MFSSYGASGFMFDNVHSFLIYGKNIIKTIGHKKYRSLPENALLRAKNSYCSNEMPSMDIL
jgi:hypothetical protein